MKNLMIVFALALTATVTAQTNSPSAATDPLEGINRLREGLVESFNKGDIDQLLSYLDTNAVVTWQNGEVCEGTAAVKAYYQRMMQGPNPIVRKVESDPKIAGRHLQGDWAISWGDLNDVFELTDGRKLPFHSHFTATIARRGDRWLVTAFHASVNAFDNSILSMAIRKTAIGVGLGGAVAGLLVGFLFARLMSRPRTTAK